MNDATETDARPRARIILAAAGLPVVTVLAGLALLGAWRSELPARLATHWGLSGEPDGFGSVTALALMMVGTTAVFAVGGTALAWSAPGHRFARGAAAFGSALSGFLVALMVGAAHGQRGLESASTARIDWWLVPVAVLVAAALGALAWALVPAWAGAALPTVGDPGRSVPLGSTELVSWSRRIANGGVPIAIIAAAMAMVVLLTVLTRQWPMLAVAAALALLAGLLHSLRVTVDSAGVLVRGPLGWPRRRIDLERIADARVTQVRALRDFGGYGIRVAVFGDLRGTTGWVLRSGEALLVDLTDGGRFLVVVDDAGTAAGLITALRAAAG